MQKEKKSDLEITGKRQKKCNENTVKEERRNDLDIKKKRNGMIMALKNWMKIF